MNLPTDFAFSSGSLQDAADCPRRFQLRHIRRLRYPAIEADPALEYEARTRQGARFHKLVQQHALGLDADLLAFSLHDDPTLAEWWRVFMESGLRDIPPKRHVEIILQTRLAGRRLIAKYDMLALQPGGSAIIIDWKTGNVPPKPWLRDRMQTVLYRYMLASAGRHLYGAPIPPERITMVYVYVAREGQRVAFDYSADQFHADEARLTELIEGMDAAEEFPLTDEKRHCRFCTYRSLCDRGEAGGLALLDEFDEEPEADLAALDFEQIAEIAF